MREVALRSQVLRSLKGDSMNRNWKQNRTEEYAVNQKKRGKVCKKPMGRPRVPMPGHGMLQCA